MIIAAASAERASFGCSDDADLTPLGRAYFHGALQHKPNFYHAFEPAAARVKELEREEGYIQHSNPASHAPAPIIELLNRWQAERAESMTLR